MRKLILIGASVLVLILGLSPELLPKPLPVAASYKIKLVNPERLLFIISANFEFPRKMDSVMFRIALSDNHYTEDYSLFVKQIDLYAADSSAVPLSKLSSGQWVAHDLKGSYLLKYSIPIEHLSKLSKYGVEETPFFLGTSGILIGTGMIVFPDLPPDQAPKDITIEFDLGANRVALLPNKSIGINKYLLPDLNSVNNMYWAVGDYDTLTIGPITNPLRLGIQRGAFDFTEPQLVEQLKKLWGQMTALFGSSPCRTPWLFVSQFPFSQKPSNNYNAGASSPGTISILFDKKLTAETLRKNLGLVAYNLFAQWDPITFSPQNRIENGWLVLGASNYYQLALSVRSGIISENEFLQRLLSAYEYYSREFDRRNISPRTARDVSGAQGYVQVAELLTACMVDLSLRSFVPRPFSLDDLLAYLAARYKGEGAAFSDQELYQLCDSLGVYFFKPLVDSCLNMSRKIDLPRILREFGVALEIIPGGKPDLGARFMTLTDLTIDDLDRGGPAEKAGLQLKDKIIKVNGKPFTAVDPLVEFLDTRKSGDKIQVEYLRDKVAGTATITLRGIDKYEISIMKTRTPAQTTRWNGLVLAK